MSAIDAYHQTLRAVGLDLGAAKAPERDAGYGGRMREYERGHIYSHPQTGTHEVHGQILSKYLSLGGHSVNPATGRRELGFPRSDETRGADGRHPVSTFEWGSIFSMPAGSVALSGSFYDEWKKAGGELGSLAYPLTDSLPAAGGEIVYCQRGALWRGPLSEGVVIRATLNPPLLGKPDLVDPTRQVRLTGGATWTIEKSIRDRIRAQRPSLPLELWQPVVLQRVTRANESPEVVNLYRERAAVETVVSGVVQVGVVLTVPQGTLRERALYNVCLRLPSGQLHLLSPHAVYAKSSWRDFGFAHATDLHVSRRLEGFRAKLRAANAATPDGTSSASVFNNFNDRLREFINYANHLHERGILDAVVASGDLIDYVFEDGDNRQGGGNFALLIDILCGRAQPSDPEGVRGEELRVPIFMTLGNHDYRPNPYTLLFELALKGAPDQDVDYTPSHNLVPADARVLQGGRPKLSQEAGKKMVAVDTKPLGWYRKWVSPESDYVVRLGPHRLVMLDSRHDVGILQDTWDAYSVYFGFAGEDKRLFAGGEANQAGINDKHLALVRTALAEAGAEGIVVIAVHGPLLNAYGSEYPHYFRETEHPTARKEETLAYLWRRAPLAPNTGFHAIAGAHKEWSLTGTPYFKTGGVGDLLDFGVSKGKAEELLALCVGPARPVELILCGHVHCNVEYRLKPDPQKRFRIYSDYYSQNPTGRYYPSLHYKKGPPLLATDAVPVHPSVRPGATPNAQPVEVREHRVEGEAVHRRLEVPPYARPLAAAADKRAWWNEHRPLHVQTAAIGPLEHRQRRLKPRTESEQRRPITFQGFRVILVRANVISAMHYVTFTELRSNKGVMSWEPPVSATLIAGGVTT